MRLSHLFVIMVVIVAFVLSACASHHRSGVEIAEHTQGPAPLEAPELYRQGVEALEQNKNDEALKDFDRFLQQNPASPWFQAATLNSGRALEGLKSWADAATRYHEVVNTTAKAPKLQAMALYRLSCVHEALGDDPQVVADLNDLIGFNGLVSFNGSPRARARFLPQEIAEGELPARLAAAYARAGNFAKAQQFYQRAEVGLARLRQQSTGTPEWLPRTLFLMGETSRSQLSWADFETFIRPLARNQVYLLQAAELGQSPWSDKAADELVQIYNDLMTTIQTAPPPTGDPILAKRALQQQQWSRVALVIDALADLRARALSENSKIAQVAKITAGLKKVDRKISDLLEQRPAGEGLTAAAIARRKARLLKTEATSDSLEQQFLKSSRNVKVGDALVPSPVPSTTDLPSGTEPIHALPVPTKSGEDPNL